MRAQTPNLSTNGRHADLDKSRRTSAATKTTHGSHQPAIPRHSDAPDFETVKKRGWGYNTTPAGQWGPPGGVSCCCRRSAGLTLHPSPVHAVSRCTTHSRARVMRGDTSVTTFFDTFPLRKSNDTNHLHKSISPRFHYTGRCFPEDFSHSSSPGCARFAPHCALLCGAHRLLRGFLFSSSVAPPQVIGRVLRLGEKSPVPSKLRQRVGWTVRTIL